MADDVGPRWSPDSSTIVFSRWEGEEVELRIDSLAYGGNGVARLDGYVVFVAGALPGDRVRAAGIPAAAV